MTYRGDYMATKILAATSCPHNGKNPTPSLFYQDTAGLVELFQLSHHYYTKLPLVEEQAFIRFLHLLIDDIEAICQQNVQVSPDYAMYHLQFTHGIENHFWQNSTTAHPFLHAVACLVQCGIDSFRIGGYPQTYSPFLEKLESLFNNHTLISAGKQRHAYLLLEQLRQKPD